MYVLEIDPPLDTKKDEDGVTMMPACTTDGGCVFNAVRKTSEMEKYVCLFFRLVTKPGLALWNNFPFL